MKVQEIKQRTTSVSEDTIYQMDSLSTFEDLQTLFQILKSQGYSIKRYSIGFDHDHSDFKMPIMGETEELLVSELKELNIREIDYINITVEYNNEIAQGKIYPQSGIFSFMIPKKKREVSFRRR